MADLGGRVDMIDFQVQPSSTFFTWSIVNQPLVTTILYPLYLIPVPRSYVLVWHGRPNGIEPLYSEPQSDALPLS